MSNDGLREYQEKLKSGVIKKTRDKNRPSAIKSIRQKCLDCICAKEEGHIDCGIEDCSLYYWQPYGRLKKERKLLKQSKLNSVNSETVNP